MSWKSKTTPLEGATSDQIKLMHTVRRFWLDQVLWTRALLISDAFSLPDKEAVTRRLYRNPEDFYALFSALYGERTAGQLQDLLKKQLDGAAALIEAVCGGDSAGTAGVRQGWYANAESLSIFLRSINEAWTGALWQALLEEQVEMTEEQAVFVLSGNNAEGIARFEGLLELSDTMADEMASGLIRQFRL
ncbi:MAG TPA: acetylglutamate kinase [Feifaniaceae bacterium]|nr:acetylglutamate kinase [Feifaniaceae bacterium]